MSSGGSGRPSGPPRPPKLFDPTDERRRRKVELERKAPSIKPIPKPNDGTKLRGGPAVVAELERALAESEDRHVFQRHAYVSALASIDGLDATLAMPYLIRMLATRQRFTEPSREPHDSLYGRLERSSHVVAFELLLDLAATQAGRRALTRHVLEIAAVAARPAPRQSSVGAGVPWADEEPVQLVEDADGGGRRPLELIQRRLPSVEWSAVGAVKEELHAPIDGSGWQQQLGSQSVQLFECGAGVLVERIRVSPPHLKRAIMTLSKNASRHGYRFAQQRLGFFEAL